MGDRQAERRRRPRNDVERRRRAEAAARHERPEPDPAAVQEPSAAERERIAGIERERRLEKLREVLADTSKCVRLGPDQVARLRADLALLEADA